ncbi:hypothetical protein NEDG_01427 [Nematocida displodere]|uniref:Uncharacterized protein n=1 Tax=Nematocida displodere TaxID=1805483 RepID=A0A177EBM4_9MICR|nr:hypothetical protein NEDG_01427 [Nematocida displodere]
MDHSSRLTDTQNKKDEETHTDSSTQTEESPPQTPDELEQRLQPQLAHLRAIHKNSPSLAVDNNVRYDSVSNDSEYLFSRILTSDISRGSGVERTADRATQHPPRTNPKENSINDHRPLSMASAIAWTIIYSIPGYMLSIPIYLCIKNHLMHISIGDIIKDLLRGVIGDISIIERKPTFLLGKMIFGGGFSWYTHFGSAWECLSILWLEEHSPLKPVLP